MELFSQETAKESALTSRAEGIKKKIETYTHNLVEMIIAVSAQAVEGLSNKEKEGLREQLSRTDKRIAGHECSNI